MSEINYKIIVLGNAVSGKEILIEILTPGSFKGVNASTIGLDKKSIELTIDIDNDGTKKSKNFNVSLFQVVGQEKYKTITKSFINGTDGIFLFYDITIRESFNDIEFWIDMIKRSFGDSDKIKYVAFLIGNKANLKEAKNEREITEEEAIKICENYDMIWGGEHNFKDMDNNKLTELFGEYVKEIYKRIGEKKVETQMKGTVDKYIKKPKKKEKKCICF